MSLTVAFVRNFLTGGFAGFVFGILKDLILYGPSEFLRYREDYYVTIDEDLEFDPVLIMKEVAAKLGGLIGNKLELDTAFLVVNNSFFGPRRLVSFKLTGDAGSWDEENLEIWVRWGPKRNLRMANIQDVWLRMVDSDKMLGLFSSFKELDDILDYFMVEPVAS